MKSLETRSTEDYSDIIDIEYHGTMTHAPMPMEKRATQFSPFAALSGMGEMFDESMRYVDEQAELTEDEIEEIDRNLQKIEAGLSGNHSVEALITYFIPDVRKEGGVYHTDTIAIKKIDRIRQVIITANKAEIPEQNILSIKATDEEDIS